MVAGVVMFISEWSENKALGKLGNYVFGKFVLGANSSGNPAINVI